MSTKIKHQLVGLLIMIGGIFITRMIWSSAQDTGRYLVQAAGVGPAAVVLGIAMILFPTYREERLAKGEDLSNLKGFQLVTPRWWVIIAIGLLAGLANLYFLGFFS
ncbi:hypothetical protein A3D25_04620 [Candidatus Daviesbacteria bacterium RIFCSPHIGHO2_02_FULL_43_12]|uniref:Uncharacterized protein n=1 Tax=Candidatus Daviesbacteria bacterium RIFCSPHIGHO2_02_FULL_43_12 TaxID=1797776 RepID=A0A1F5KGP7_9BACT|nr:MAG: hypothetical protein A3D25_04620 [Candidatus Daviesbacteria bacterium RIFCSPHIGHO2_02_FULL_43_12]OGE41460.1 MAG: hypothetical protein A3E86_05190 [Candidatus Daviesbacteria bacterium RIFCSPHIGHO2_12_FULL_47_45]OGE70262.1 MAG: hypothetical protein A3B55_00950 [Candidatus Daviesbacteria bacterium RIFCSPLOWO2_01_FULL_43_15]